MSNSRLIHHQYQITPQVKTSVNRAKTPNCINAHNHNLRLKYCDQREKKALKKAIKLSHRDISIRATDKNMKKGKKESNTHEHFYIKIKL